MSTFPFAKRKIKIHWAPHAITRDVFNSLDTIERRDISRCTLVALWLPSESIDAIRLRVQKQYSFKYLSFSWPYNSLRLMVIVVAYSFLSGTKKMEYKTRQWHEKCFCCVVCKNPIGTKSFIPREQEIYCAGCYEDKFATRCVKCNKVRICWLKNKKNYIFFWNCISFCTRNYLPSYFFFSFSPIDNHQRWSDI